MDVNRKVHLDGIGLFIGQGFHANDGLTFFYRHHPPVDPPFTLRIDGYRFDAFFSIYKRKTAAFKFQLNTGCFFVFQVVVNIGRQHDLVGLHKKSRCLETQNQILAGHDFDRSLPDHGAVSHGPHHDFPTTEIFRHVKFDFRTTCFVGQDLTFPVNGIGELGAHLRFDLIPCGC